MIQEWVTNRPINFLVIITDGGDQGVEQALAKYGFHKDDVTDVFLTHLHFDHCGGGVEWNLNKTGYQLAFKNATYWSNKEHWSWAKTPNKREKHLF